MRVGGGAIQVLLADACTTAWTEAISYLQDAGLEVLHVLDGADAATALAAKDFDVLVTNISSTNCGQMELVRQARALRPDLHILIATNSPNVDTAVAALHHRVQDYFTAPVDKEHLLRSIRRAIANDGATARSPAPAPAVRTAAACPVQTPKHLPLLGESEGMRRVRDQIAAIAPHNVTVLVQGETGTGKDLVARLLHAKSPRAQHGEFYKVNCPSIPESLFESEMFGHEQGAFTGATAQRLGRFELAHNGTLFLDEIGLLPMSMQAKLLEVLEYKAFLRVGGRQKLEVDTRVVSATNAPLDELAREGTFRLDLLYRIRVCTICLPPLRERSEDIPELLDFFLHKYATRYGMPVRRPPRDCIAALMQRSWPGNVRELAGLVSRFTLQNDASVFDETVSDMPVSPAQVNDSLASSEARMLKATLAKTGWNQREAAKSVGLSYSAFRRRLRKHNISRPTADASSAHSLDSRLR